METDAVIAVNETVSNEFDNLTDEEIVLKIKAAGGRAALDYLIHKYRNFVRAKARSYFLIGADREDIIQEGMIGLYKAVRDYDAGRDASFYTFADLCVSRQMYKAVEAQNRKKHAPLNSYVSIYEDETGKGDAGEVANIPELLSQAGMSPEDVVIDKEQTERLEQKIYDSLSDFERKVFNLRLTGLEYTDIARILGRDEKSTDNALSRIKVKVRKILSK